MWRSTFSLFLLLGTLAVSYAQTNCKCNLSARFSQDDDSVTVYKTINSLKQNGEKVCAADAYNIEIAYLIYNRKLNAVYELIRHQEKLVAAHPCKKDLEINVYLNYVNYFKAKEDFENLSLFAFKALENAEGRNDKTNQLKAISSIVYLFTRQDQDEKNWAYIKKAEKIINSLEDDSSTANHFNWLAFEYENKYTLTERATLLDSAMIFATKAKNIATRFNDYEQLTQSFRVFEACAYHHEELKQAIGYVDSALFYAKKTKVPANLSSLYLSKAWDFIDLKENEEAMRWQDTSIFYAEKYQHGTAITMNIYSEAAQIFEAAGNIPKAFASFKKYEHLKDSIFKIQRSEKINELEQRYEKDKNEKTIRELALQKKIYLLFALAGLLGLTALAFFIRQQSFKNKQKILEAEQRLNRARMNPHFFFNALSSLQSFALQENDGKALATNISKFSYIMRETLESTYKDFVTVEQEVDFLNKYLELQKMRFPQKFTYEIKVVDSIESDETLVPSMILQPFIENSIEHGFTGIDHAGNIFISFEKTSKELQIKIVDNGKGLSANSSENIGHISRAGQIIKDRIYLLNIKLKTNAAFSIENNKDQKGATVFIKLPLLYKQDLKNN